MRNLKNHCAIYECITELEVHEFLQNVKSKEEKLIRINELIELCGRCPICVKFIRRIASVR